MASDEPVKYRVGNVTLALILALTGFADLVQVFADLTGILAVVATFITVCVEGAVNLWLLLKLGKGFLGGKKSVSKISALLGTWIIELIPFVNVLPGLTLGTYAIIRASRKEDTDKAREVSAQEAQLFEEAA